MAAFDSIDEDKLVKEVYKRVQRALIRWMGGAAADETALMNQMSTEFNHPSARKCDIGMSGAFTVKSELFELHRKGLNQVDEYGSDLAITVKAPDFTKTAFFQFKIAKDGIARVESKQIRDAKRVEEVYERAFVFTVDRESRLIRLASVPEVGLRIDGDGSMGFRINTWESFSEWLLNWFRCKRGKPSNAQDAKSVEALLRKFAVPDQQVLFGDTWELPGNYSPARSWLETELKPPRQ